MTVTGEGSGQRRRLVPRDLQIVRQASATIADLGDDLDRRLAQEQRAAERRRMLRETMNRIIRTANDAVQAYARASRAVRTEMRRPSANLPLAEETRNQLDSARDEVLAAIEAARRRYPPLVEDAAAAPAEPE